jgi:hypothetical protein
MVQAAACGKVWLDPKHAKHPCEGSAKSDAKIQELVHSLHQQIQGG